MTAIPRRTTADTKTQALDMTSTDKALRLLSVKEVTGRLRVSRTTLHVLITTGEFPRPVRMRGRILWPESAVDDWIAARFAAENRDHGEAGSEHNG